MQAARHIGAEYDAAGKAVQQVGALKEKVGDQLARNVGSAIQDAGRVAVDYEDHREISHGAAEYAKANDALTNRWNETVKNADPNDPAVAAKFREEVVEPTLEKFRGGFNTERSQEWAEHQIEQTRNHFFQKTAADMSTLAADAVAVNVKTMSNTMSNTAMADPTSVPHLLSTIDHSVGAMVDSSPNLTGAPAAKARMQLTEGMREGIVKAGAIGAIQNARDPDAAAAEWGKRYPQYINGAELKQLSAAATRENSYRRTDENIARLNQDRIRKEASEGRRDQIIQNLYSDEPQRVSSVTAKAISRDPNLTVQDKEHLINVVNRELKPETDAKISAQSSVGILRAMRDPNADPQKINDMIFGARTKDPGQPGSITKSDMADLQKQLVDLKTPEGAALAADRNDFFKRFAATVDPSVGSTGQHSALGSQKMYEAEKAARRAEADARTQGQDPHSVYDPGSPNYFAKQLPKFRPTLQQINAYQADIEKGARMDRADEEAKLQPGARKQFKQGWGVWDGKAWTPEAAK